MTSLGLFLLIIFSLDHVSHFLLLHMSSNFLLYLDILYKITVEAELNNIYFPKEDALFVSVCLVFGTESI